MNSIQVTSSQSEGGAMSAGRAAETVVEVVKAGGLAVVPLDVSYAFLAATRGALERIYDLKVRPASKPCPILASWEHFVEATAASPAHIQRVERAVAAGLPVGMLTRPDRRSDVVRRIPADCSEMLIKDDRLALFVNMGGMAADLIAAAEANGVLLFGSSANISGTGNSFSIEDVPKSMLESVDVVCDAGRCRFSNPDRLASTILDVESGALTRRGIAADEIEKRLLDSD